MMKHTLPNFIIAGAQKAGTTFLYNVLEQHPAVSMSNVKEIHFFDIEEHYAKGLKFYSSFFNNDGHMTVGEATPNYMAYPHVAPRIFQDLGPQIKLIFVLRHPVDRAFSHFKMSLARTWIDRPLTVSDFPHVVEKSLAEDESVGIGPTGLYYKQLKQYFDLFPHKNILTLVFETDVHGDTSRTMSQVCSFLNIPEYDFNFDVSRNQSGTPKYKAVNRLLYNDKSLIKRFVKSVVYTPAMRDRIRKKVLEMNLKPDKDRLDPQTRLELYTRFYEADVRRLEKLLGRDLDCWRSAKP